MEGTDTGGFEWEVRRFEVLDSTNRYLIDQARAGAPEGTVAVADYQEAGRGRLDRRWVAPPGSSLLVSVLLRPALVPDDLHLVVAITALAAADASQVASGIRPLLKWPNDLIVQPVAGAVTGHKLAGVLAEADWSTSLPSVVVGIGINVNWPSDQGELAELAGATSLNLLCGRQVDREELLRALLDGIAVRFRELTSEPGRRGQMKQYRERCATIGQRVTVTTHDESFGGTALDVDDAGRLLVDVGACIRTIAVGDVVHLSPES